jgi:hypothetical protein
MQDAGYRMQDAGFAQRRRDRKDISIDAGCKMQVARIISRQRYRFGGFFRESICLVLIIVGEVCANQNHVVKYRGNMKFSLTEDFGVSSS